MSKVDLYAASDSEGEEDDEKPRIAGSDDEGDWDEDEEAGGEGGLGQDLPDSDEDDEGDDGIHSKPYFAAKKCLPPEEFGTKSTKELFKMMKSGTINLSPAYQRDDVWPLPRRALLISSLLGNLHVPELLFNIHDVPDKDDPTSTRSEWATCDGKQRLTTIKKFMRGDFPVVDDNDDKYYYPAERLGPTARVFDAAMKAKFDSIRLRYGAYRNLSGTKERLLFNRTQQGMTLTPAGLKSNKGPWADWTRELCDQYFGQKRSTFAKRITIPTRSSEFVTMLSMARNLNVGLSAVTSLNQDELIALVTTKSLPSKEEQAKILRVLDRFQQLTMVKALPEDQVTFATKVARLEPLPWPHRAWRPQNITAPNLVRPVAPVEMDFLPLIIEKWNDRSDGDLLEIIERFRSVVYATHGGKIMRNAGVVTFMRDWINNFDLQSLTHKYKDNGKRNAERLPSPEAPPAPKPRATKTKAAKATGDPPKTSTKSAGKRKATRDDSSSEEEPLAKKSKAPSDKARSGAASGSGSHVNKDVVAVKKKETPALTEEQMERRRQEREKAEALKAMREGGHASTSTAHNPATRPQSYANGSSSASASGFAPSRAGAWTSAPPLPSAPAQLPPQSTSRLPPPNGAASSSARLILGQLQKPTSQPTPNPYRTSLVNHATPPPPQPPSRAQPSYGGSVQQPYHSTPAASVDPRRRPGV